MPAYRDPPTKPRSKSKPKLKQAPKQLPGGLPKNRVPKYLRPPAEDTPKRKVSKRPERRDPSGRQNVGKILAPRKRVQREIKAIAKGIEAPKGHEGKAFVRGKVLEGNGRTVQGYTPKDRPFILYSPIFKVNKKDKTDKRLYVDQKRSKGLVGPSGDTPEITRQIGRLFGKKVSKKGKNDAAQWLLDEGVVTPTAPKQKRLLLGYKNYNAVTGGGRAGGQKLGKPAKVSIDGKVEKGYINDRGDFTRQQDLGEIVGNALKPLIAAGKFIQRTGKSLAETNIDLQTHTFNPERAKNRAKYVITGKQTKTAGPNISLGDIAVKTLSKGAAAGGGLVLEGLDKPLAAVESGIGKGLVELGAIKGDTARRIRESKDPWEYLYKSRDWQKDTTGGTILEGLGAPRELGIAADLALDPLMWVGIALAPETGGASVILALQRLERVAPELAGLVKATRAKYLADPTHQNARKLTKEVNKLLRDKRAHGIIGKARADRAAQIIENAQRVEKSSREGRTAILGRRTTQEVPAIPSNVRDVAEDVMRATENQRYNPSPSIRLMTPLGREIRRLEIPKLGAAIGRLPASALPLGQRSRTLLASYLDEKQRLGATIRNVQQRREEVDRLTDSAREMRQRGDVVQAGRIEKERDEVAARMRMAEQEARDIAAADLKSARISDYTSMKGTRNTIHRGTLWGREFGRMVQGKFAKRITVDVQPITRNWKVKASQRAQMLERAVLVAEFETSNPLARREFEEALGTLSRDERAVVNNLRKTYREMAQQGLDAGTLRGTIEDYMPRVWGTADAPKRSPREDTDAIAHGTATTGPTKHRAVMNVTDYADRATLARTIERLSTKGISQEDAFRLADKLHESTRERFVSRGLLTKMRMDDNAVHFDDLTEFEQGVVQRLTYRGMGPGEETPMFTVDAESGLILPTGQAEHGITDLEHLRNINDPVLRQGAMAFSAWLMREEIRNAMRSFDEGSDMWKQLNTMRQRWDDEIRKVDEPVPSYNQPYRSPIDDVGGEFRDPNAGPGAAMEQTPGRTDSAGYDDFPDLSSAEIEKRLNAPEAGPVQGPEPLRPIPGTDGPKQLGEGKAGLFRQWKAAMIREQRQREKALREKYLVGSADYETLEKIINEDKLTVAQKIEAMRRRVEGESAAIAPDARPEPYTQLEGAVRPTKANRPQWHVMEGGRVVDGPFKTRKEAEALLAGTKKGQYRVEKIIRHTDESGARAPAQAIKASKADQPKWYIFKDGAIHAGPYKTQKKAKEYLGNAPDNFTVKQHVVSRELVPSNYEVVDSVPVVDEAGNVTWGAPTGQPGQAQLPPGGGELPPAPNLSPELRVAQGQQLAPTPLVYPGHWEQFFDKHQNLFIQGPDATRPPTLSMDDFTPRGVEPGPTDNPFVFWQKLVDDATDTTIKDFRGVHGEMIALDPREVGSYRARVHGVLMSVAGRLSATDEVFGRSANEYWEREARIKATGEKVLARDLHPVYDHNGTLIGWHGPEQRVGTDLVPDAPVGDEVIRQWADDFVGPQYKLDEIEFDPHTLIPGGARGETPTDVPHGAFWLDPHTGENYRFAKEYLNENNMGILTENVGQDRLWPSQILQQLHVELGQTGEFDQMYWDAYRGMMDATLAKLRFGVTTPFPAYHIRNLISDIIKSMQADSGVMFHPIVNMKLAAGAFNIGKGRKINIPGYGKMQMEDFLFMADMYGVSSGHHMAEVGQLLKANWEVQDRSMFTETVSRLNPFKAGGWTTTGGDHRENIARLWTFTQRLRSNGGDAADAALYMIRHHFNYNDLRAYERRFVRNLFLFYTWYRNNIPLQLLELGRRPGFFAGVSHFYHAAENGETPVSLLPPFKGPAPPQPGTPDYVKDKLYAITLPWKGHAANFGFGAPWGDLNWIAWENLPNLVVQNANPLIYGALNLGGVSGPESESVLPLRADPLTGREYYDYEAGGPANVINFFAEQFGTELPKDERGRPVLPWRALSVLRQIPIFGRATSGMVETSDARDPGNLQSFLSHHSGWLTGVSGYIAPAPGSEREDLAIRNQIVGRVKGAERLRQRTTNLSPAVRERAKKDYIEKTGEWAKDREIPKEALGKVKQSGYYKRKSRRRGSTIGGGSGGAGTLGGGRGGSTLGGG